MRRLRTPLLAGVAMVLVGIVTLQSGSALAVRLFERSGPTGTTFLRLALAAAILVALRRPRIRAFDRADWRAALLLGLALGTMNWAFYQSIARIPLGAAVTVELSGPILIALAGTRRAADLLWVCLAGAGIALLTPLTAGGSALDPAGVGFAALAATCWAWYILATAHAGSVFGRRVGLGQGLAVAMVIAAAVVAPWAIASAGGRLLAPVTLALGLVVALVSSVIPYSLELEALRRMPTRAFGVLLSLEPAVAAASGAAFLGQHMRAIDLVAIACVVAASAGATYSARDPAPTVIDP